MAFLTRIFSSHAGLRSRSQNPVDADGPRNRLSKNRQRKKNERRKEGAHPDALEHVDNVVDPSPLHAEAPGGVVQPDGLHVVPVVQGHEAAGRIFGEEGKTRIDLRNVAGTRERERSHSLGAEEAERLLLAAVAVVAQFRAPAIGEHRPGERRRLRGGCLGRGRGGGRGHRRRSESDGCPRGRYMQDLRRVVRVSKDRSRRMEFSRGGVYRREDLRGWGGWLREGGSGGR